MFFMNNGIWKCCNFLFNLEAPALSISTTIKEEPRALPHFIAFRAVDTMLCLTIGGVPSTEQIQK